MKFKLLFTAFSTALLFSTQVIAQESNTPPSTPLEVGSKALPKIAVRWDCGDCEQNPKVAPLIETSYETEASSKGYTVSSKESAEIIIKDYRQRNPAARVLLGVFAGKDRLATKLVFRGKEYDANDYSANAFQGMNSLCQSIAQQALAQVLSAIKE